MNLKKSQKIICILLVVLFAAGVFLTVYSASRLVFENWIENNYVHEYAVVSHLKENSEGKDDYWIAYNANGQHFETVFEKADRKTYIGETLDMYYEEGNPENFVIMSSGGLKYMLAAGILLAVFALVILALIIVPFIIRHRLVKSNKWAMCRVTKLKKDSKKAVRIYCDSSKFKKRKGKPFVSLPVEKEKLPKNIKESSMTVYYSEKNPNFYFVDTDKLN